MNNEYTLVFDGTPNLHGSVDTTPMTPTFMLASEPFSGEVSGRNVERSFRFDGEAVENGEVLQGIYTEVMTGFTPKPMVTEGLFMLTRPSNAAENTMVLTLSTSPMSVSTGGSSTATATVVDQNGQPVSGVEVTFSANLGNMSPASATTNANGQASATFTAGSQSGQANITALAGTATASANIQIGDATISDVHTSNVRDVSFTVSWLTDIVTTGEVRYGTDPNNLNQTATDTRGAATNSQTHYVVLGNLLPNTTYYFDVVSGNTTDNNHQVTTGPTLDVSGSDLIFGKVFKPDGTTYATGTIVYITLQDANNTGSPGSSYLLSALVEDNGFWSTNLGDARLANLSDHFSYSASGDQLLLKADGAADRRHCHTTINTANDDPAPDMVLTDEDCWSINLAIGWNKVALPLSLATSLTAEQLCTQIAEQGGSIVEIDRWYNGGWSGHACGYPFNNFDIELGVGYFIKADAVSDWSISGSSVSSASPLNLQIGWNSISLPHTEAYSAESLCNAINQHVTVLEIDRWHNGGWQGHPCGLPFNDFPIERGKGYFVKSSSSGTVTPSERPSRLGQPEQAEPHSPKSIPTGESLPIRDLRLSNLRDTSVTLSWITEKPTTGYVRFTGAAAPPQSPPIMGGKSNEERVAYDSRGATTSSTIHYVVLDHLTPESTYNFEIVSGAEVLHTDSVTTAPLLESVPESDSIYGQIKKADGVTPAAGTLLYLTLQDADGVGSESQAILESALVDEQGYWYANLGNVRTAKLNSYFNYSSSGDQLLIEAQGADGGTTSQTVDTANDSPALDITVSTANDPTTITIGAFNSSSHRSGLGIALGVLALIMLAGLFRRGPWG